MRIAASAGKFLANSSMFLSAALRRTVGARQSLLAIGQSELVITADEWTERVF